MEFKKTITNEEIQEVIDWFEKHWDKLPQSIQTDQATNITNFKRTLKLYYDIAKEHANNPTYSGQVYHLFQMKEAVEKLWKQNAEMPTE